LPKEILKHQLNKHRTLGKTSEMIKGFWFLIPLTGISRLNIGQDGWTELQDLLTKLVSICRTSHSCTFTPHTVIQGSGGGVGT
jgi:hypothetical protein